MEKVYFYGITEMGCCIQNACVIVPNDYTMNQLVTAIRAAGYKAFKLDTMRIFVEI